MCGIVGYIGVEKPISIVLGGLEKLEYRGYDSAGVSFLDKNGKLATVKKEGRLANLVSAVKDMEATEAAIGHTRWATHGKVSEQNSHPHSSDAFSLVHNGIIENASLLKEQFFKDVRFSSETDTEVFVKLIERELAKGSTVLESVLASFKLIEGNSAFVVLDKKQKTIFGIRNNAPLVCGISESGANLFISSDPYAVSGIKNINISTLYFPENGVLCELRLENQEVKFLGLDGKPSSEYKVESSFILDQDSGKGEFEHYMLKEIFEQPGLVRESISHYFKSGFSLNKIDFKKVDRVFITACGTAYYAGLVIKNYIENFLGKPVYCEVASELRYKKPFITSGDLGIFISQSGETADTLACQQLFKDKNVFTLSILNSKNSSLDRSSDETMHIYAGQEIGVASTKAFTMQCLVGRFFVDFLLNNKLDSSLKSKIELLSNRMRDVIERSEEIKKVAYQLYSKTAYFFTGRGDLFPVALEGALKLKEISYVHAEGYASGELKHGPIAIIDENVVNIAYVGLDLVDKTVSNIQEIRTRNGIIFSIGNTGSKELTEISDYNFHVDLEGLDEFAPVLLNVVGQLFAYHVAKYKGTDIDKPRNLAKSVTVE
ncbi:MAG: glutamine--fructose-6-phosphate transaminase (isomerizing) [Halobacteriovoraceae bacterium]|nr:glutamine--fructose-6-phosphate transaminase (isomerizing) [Halobacteriovoraceae bacterium]